MLDQTPGVEAWRESKRQVYDDSGNEEDSHVKAWVLRRVQGREVRTRDITRTRTVRSETHAWKGRGKYGDDEVKTWTLQGL
jgi:hypothetical protein